MKTAAQQPLKSRSWHLFALALAFVFQLAGAQAQSDYDLPNHRIGPFADVEWQNDVPMVLYSGSWYRFVSLNGMSADSIITFTKQKDGYAWRDQFGLNFPYLLYKLQRPNIRTVRLELLPENADMPVTFRNVEMTEENWYTLAYNRLVVRRRINREHATTVPESLAFVVQSTAPPELGDGPENSKTPWIPVDGPMGFAAWMNADFDRWMVGLSQYITREQAEKDLDQLEWLLEHQYSYLHRRNIPYREGLDAIRANLPEQISRNDFGLQLQRVLGLFGDMHLRVRDGQCLLKWNNRNQQLPFIARLHGERVVALRPDRAGFLFSETPYIKSIQDIPVAEWRKAAQQLETGGKRAMLRAKEEWTWPSFGLLAATLHVNATMIDVVFESANGAQTHRATYNSLGFTAIAEVEQQNTLLPGNIAYMKLPVMDRSDEFVPEQVRFMKEKARNASGLIIDLRGNHGGKKHIVPALMPFFLNPKKGPQLINFRAKRQDAHNSPGIPFFDEESSLFKPASSARWSPAERSVVKELERTLNPEMPLPTERFSSNYYWLASAGDPADGFYYFDKPVVLITDHKCYSTTELLLGAMQQLPNVTVIGEPTSGGSGGADTERLFYSQIFVKVPKMASFMPTGTLYETNGIRPDILMEPSLSDIEGQTDTALDKAIKLISNSPRK